MALSDARREDRRNRIVSAAQALLRARGDAGFSMTELASKAGVSPATPYNLVGSKADVLRLIVQAEFQDFIGKLDGQPKTGPLQNLLDATALVVDHYEADREFYRALFHAAFNADARDIHDSMKSLGQALWSRMVQDAIDSGELRAVLRAAPLTDVILRNISAVTLSWLAEDWPHERFAREMALSMRLVLAAAASQDLRDRMCVEIDRLVADFEGDAAGPMERAARN